MRAFAAQPRGRLAVMGAASQRAHNLEHRRLSGRAQAMWIVPLSAVALVLPLLLPTSIVAEAQPMKSARLGYLSSNPPSDTEAAVDAFRKRLRDFGYVEGQNLVIEYRYAEGSFE